MGWVLKSVDPFKRNLLSWKFGISPITASVLINRGICDEDDVELFLYPALDKLHDPFEMKGIREGVQRIRDALNRGEKILIYGDYDVDGVSATAVLLLGLKEFFKEKVSYFIPHRVKEGYGLHGEIVKYARDKGFSLIITVDCGIKGGNVVSEGRKMGLDFIITDHHLPGEELPEGAIVIDPHQPGCDYPFKELAGVGVAWKLISAFLGKPYLDVLDLVAIGTIADLVPLRGENRILVKEGLKLLNPPSRPGLRELLREAGVKPSRRIDEWVIGFIIAPRLNSAGRMDIADISVKLLTTASLVKARKLAGELNGLNSKRKSIGDRILSEAEEELSDEPIIFLYEEDWHLGVLGIVASRLVEKYGKPAFLMCGSGDRVKGSARGLEGFRIDEALGYCADLLEAYGGHEMAGGFSLFRENVDSFREKLLRFASRKSFVGEDMCWIDGHLTARDLTLSLARELSSLSPWGKGNPQPIFLMENVILQRSSPSNGHFFKAIKDGVVFDVFSWKHNVSLPEGKRVSLLGFWGVDGWTGLPCFRVEDILNGGESLDRS
ncbi:MAG: single-stranded-DNA-specific exonuclease RecJ [Synergistetes bacterium]|nr:single-stranded-DNA-specific exonuclease RecJ [Synergistota bacterium]